MAKLRHIAIAVKDPAQAAQFYMRAFGMEKVGESDSTNARAVYLSDGVVNLALLDYKTDAAAGEERGRDWVGVHHFGFWVDDVAATRKAIEAAGGRHWMGDAAEGDGFYEMKFHDPNGIVVDITANGWGGAAKDVVAVDAPAQPARRHGS